MRSRQLGISPAKIAIAVAVTIEAIAGTGGMKNVTGTRSAVAMVAVSPGTAPTKSPKMADARITHRTYGSNTSANACARTPAVSDSSYGSERPPLEHAPRQRHAQELVEREMDQQRGDDRDGHGHAPRCTEQPHPQREQQEPGDVEAQSIYGEDVDHQPAEQCGDAGSRPGATEPFRGRDPRRAFAHSGGNEQHAASPEARRDQAGKPGGAELLARHRRESLDMPEDDPGEDDERRARQRIADSYLASPTAFNAPPRLASEAAMNLVVPSASAQTTPKPRLAMNSL